MIVNNLIRSLIQGSEYRGKNRVQTSRIDFPSFFLISLKIARSNLDGAYIGASPVQEKERDRRGGHP